MKGKVEGSSPFKKTRQGCLTCRRRKKKCDLSKPICSACTRLNIECQYGTCLSWKEHYQHTLSKHDAKVYKQRRSECNNYSTKGPLPLVNFSFAEMSVFYQRAGTEHMQRPPPTDEEERLEQFLPPMELVLDRLGMVTGSPLPLSKDELQDIEAFLFAHFKDTCKEKSFGFSSDIENGYLDLVLPECYRCHSLDQIVLSLSALDVAKQKLLHVSGSEDRASIELYYCLHIKYLNSSISLLYDDLDHFDISKVDSVEQLMLSLVLLCSVQITSKGNQNWVRYLAEACMIFSTLTQEVIESSSRLMFGYRYFSIRYILLITTMCENKLAKFMKQTPLVILHSFFENKHLDPMLGCSPRQSYLIYQLTLLEKGNANNSQYSELWDQLNGTNIAQGNETRGLTLCSQIYGLASRIYFCMVLKRSKSSLYKKGKFESIFELLVPQLFNNFDLLDRVSRGDFYPSWCMLILCNSETLSWNSDESRREVMRLMTPIEERIPLCSIVPLRQAIETIWKVRDLDEEHTLDWRLVLEKYGFMLALT